MSKQVLRRGRIAFFGMALSLMLAFAYAKPSQAGSYSSQRGCDHFGPIYSLTFGSGFIYDCPPYHIIRPYVESGYLTAVPPHVYYAIKAHKRHKYKRRKWRRYQ